MYKYILESAGDIDWLALFPLLVFFVFFTLTIVRVMLEKKSFIKKMEQLPLDEDSSLSNQ